MRSPAGIVWQIGDRVRLTMLRSGRVVEGSVSWVSPNEVHVIADRRPWLIRRNRSDGSWPFLERITDEEEP